MKILLVFFTPIMIFAHSLSVTASYEDGELFIESFFGDGKPCANCKFDVKKGEEELYEGTLDDEGVFEKQVELKPPFDVHIDGSMGHWADVKIDGTEIQSESSSALSSNTTISNLDEAKIRQIIRSELNKQNGKIESIVKKNESNLEKMLVGLGYILGIFGLWQLFMNRREK